MLKQLNNQDKRKYIEENCTRSTLVRKTMEECGELIQAVNKWYDTPKMKQGEEARSNLITEMADIMVCIKHMQSLAHIPDTTLAKEIDYKLDRAYKRIKYGQAEKEGEQ